MVKQDATERSVFSRHRDGDFADGASEGKKQVFELQIDDLPLQTIHAASDAELAELLRERLAEPPLERIGRDVHATIRRPDGSYLTRTIAELRNTLLFS